MVLRSLPFGLCLAILSLCSRGIAAGQDDSIVNSEIGRLNNQSLLWGPYRPNLYFGVRPRIPQSLMAGMMWAKVDNYVDVQNSMSHTYALRLGDGC